MPSRTIAILQLLAAAALVAVQYALWSTLGLREHLLDYGPQTAERTNPGEVTLAVLLLLGIPAAMLVARAWQRLTQTSVLDLLAARPERVALVCAGIATLTAMAITVGVTGGAPFTTDERTQLWQARALLAGSFTAPLPLPGGAFFNHFMIAVGADRWGGLFPSGQPLLLVPGTALGVPHLTNWLAGGAIVWVASRTATRTWDARTGVLVAILLASSPALVLTSATLHSVIPTTLFVVLAIASGLAVARGSLWAAAGLGASAGGALLCRPLDGALIAIVGAAVILACSRRRIAASALAIAAGLPLFALHLYAQYALTGDPLVSPYQLWLARNWPDATIFGFGTTVWNYEHTPAIAAHKTLAMLVRMNMWAFGWPASLAGLALWIAGRGVDRPTRWLAAAIALHAAAYTLYAFSSVHDLGSYYHLVGVPALAMITARAALATPRVLSLVGPLVALSLLVFVPLQLSRVRLVADRIEAPVRLAESVAETEPIVVFHDAMHGTQRSWVSFAPLPSPQRDDAVLWVRAMRPIVMQSVLLEHPGRRPYVLRWVDDAPQLAPINTQ